MLGTRGVAKGTLTALVAVLAIVLVVVMFLWMQDREAKDVELEIGSRSVPAHLVPA